MTRSAAVPRAKLGVNVFKIAETNNRPIFRPVIVPEGSGPFSTLPQYCIADDWSANLADGTIRLGHWSAAMHGLSECECGLTSLTRAYDPADRRHIVGLFEKASAASASFCFSTTISLGEGHLQPVFCMAQSLPDVMDGCDLHLNGVFLFPRFKLDMGAEVGYPGPMARLG
jgi:hypothetical protein